MKKHKNKTKSNTAYRDAVQTTSDGVSNIANPTHPSGALSVNKILTYLEESELGDLSNIADLFEDMEERDGHLFSEIGKRRLAVTNLEDYQLQPPKNPTPAEQKAYEQVLEMWEAIPNKESLIYQMSDAIGKGLSAIELTWKQVGNLYTIKSADLKPLAWFKLTGSSFDQIKLRDANNQLHDLWQYGWLTHWHNPRSGYNSRNALYRALVIPYLLKNYSIQDWAEFNEKYGQPLRVGKYDASATAEQKEVLRKAVTHLGHNAAGIIPKSMEIELVNIGGSLGHTSYLEFIQYIDKIISKCILGGTLTSDNSSTGSYSLGMVHEEVRQDIFKSDVRQIAATISEQLILPLSLNFPAFSVDRYPRLVASIEDEVSLNEFSEAVNKLVGAGVKLPFDWIYSKLKIPKPAEDEEILEQMPKLATFSGQKLASLNTKTSKLAENKEKDDIDELIDDLSLADMFAPIYEPIKQALEKATSLEEFRNQLANLIEVLGVDFVTEQLAQASSIINLLEQETR